MLERISSLGILLCTLIAGCQSNHLESAGDAAPQKGQSRLVNSFGMEFVEIPTGSHQVSEGQTHKVSSFYLQTTELTFRQLGEIKAKRDDVPATDQHSQGEEGSSYPVPISSWNEANKLAASLSSLDEQYDYRLPTESEWMYACAAGADIQGKLAVEVEDDLDRRSGPLAPAKSRPANSFGLYDMLSNMGEYCDDTSQQGDEDFDGSQLVKGMPSEGVPRTFCITDAKKVPATGTEDLLIGVRFVLVQKSDQKI